jgi:hypothetical protein
MSQTAPVSPEAVKSAAQKLDAHVREIVEWHFSPETGTPFWLEWARKAGWDPRKEVRSLRGRLVAGRAGAALGAEGLCEQTVVCV